MKAITSQELHTQTPAIQKLAQKEPVLIIDDNAHPRQILMDYENFLQLTTEATTKSFISLGEVFSNLPPDIAQALAIVEEDDDLTQQNVSMVTG